MPNLILKTRSSLGVSDDKILVVVSLKELLTAASIGIKAFLSSIKSPKELSSSSPTGVCKLIGSSTIALQLGQSRTQLTNPFSSVQLFDYVSPGK